MAEHPAARGVDYATARRIALELPFVTEGSSYGTQALKCKGKFMARLKEDGETLVLRMNIFERPYLLEAEPDVFYITDHYREWPCVLLRLPVVTEPRLREAVLDAWRYVAPPKVVAAFDAANASP